MMGKVTCDSIAELGYELYKQAWLSVIPYSTRKKLLRDYYDELKSGEYDESFEDYLCDNGYDGQMYSTFEDFLEKEYKDEDYMRLLYSEKQFQEYKRNIEHGIDPEIFTLRAFCRKYKRGDFDSSDRETQIKAGWFDWFCDESELCDKLNTIWQILSGITNDFLLDNFVVSFANKCPAGAYPFYDAIFFKPIDTQKMNSSDCGFTISIGDARTGCRYSVETERSDYNAEGHFDDIDSIVEFCNDWEEMLKDETFYAKRAERDAEMKALCDKAADILSKYA